MKLPFSVSFPPGLYEVVDVQAERVEKDQEDVTLEPCGARSSREVGCRSIVLPRAPERPHLTVSVSKGREVLAYATIARLAPDDRMKVTVRQMHAGRLGRAAAAETFSPDVAGDIRARVTIPVSPATSEVCVRAKFIPAGHVASIASTARERAGCEGGRYAGVAMLRMNKEAPKRLR